MLARRAGPRIAKASERCNRRARCLKSERGARGRAAGGGRAEGRGRTRPEAGVWPGAWCGCAWCGCASWPSRRWRPRRPGARGRQGPSVAATHGSPTTHASLRGRPAVPPWTASCAGRTSIGTPSTSCPAWTSRSQCCTTTETPSSPRRSMHIEVGVPSEWFIAPRVRPASSCRTRSRVAIGFASARRSKGPCLMCSRCGRVDPISGTPAARRRTSPGPDTKRPARAAPTPGCTRESIRSARGRAPEYRPSPRR